MIRGVAGVGRIAKREEGFVARVSASGNSQVNGGREPSSLPEAPDVHRNPAIADGRNSVQCHDVGGRRERCVDLQLQSVERGALEVRGRARCLLGTRDALHDRRAAGPTGKRGVRGGCNHLSTAFPLLPGLPPFSDPARQTRVSRGPRKEAEGETMRS